MSNSLPNEALALLDYDIPQELDRITTFVRTSLRRRLKRRGLVVAMSGGIDSSLCAALAVAAVGPKRVYGVLLPERDSSPESVARATELADQLGINREIQNIGPTLESVGCYSSRDDAIRRVFPDYGDGWKNKIVIRSGSEHAFSHFELVVECPDGSVQAKRLALKEYLQIVAATNYKQRIRKSIEYYCADKLNYAVVGTPNRLEYDQGFFVKNGDGAADIKPIAHLYKTQVYAMARHMGIPDSICNARPTTDTYSMSQGQDEFYFALPYQQMDIALLLHDREEPPEKLARLIGIDVTAARNVYIDIERKRSTTAYLHLPPLLSCGYEVCSGEVDRVIKSEPEQETNGSLLLGEHAAVVS